jgi:hypothetical protein
MLNPSTADAETNDPTNIRRCIRFAIDIGCGSLEVVNLFALRATDPRELARHPDAVGPQNERYLHDAAFRADWLICAWGAHAFAMGQSGRHPSLFETERAQAASKYRDLLRETPASERAGYLPALDAALASRRISADDHAELKREALR